jgi:hypothetical protein
MGLRPSFLPVVPTAAKIGLNGPKYTHPGQCLTSTRLLLSWHAAAVRRVLQAAPAPGFEAERGHNRHQARCQEPWAYPGANVAVPGGRPRRECECAFRWRRHAAFMGRDSQAGPGSQCVWRMLAVMGSPVHCLHVQPLFMRCCSRSTAHPHHHQLACLLRPPAATCFAHMPLLRRHNPTE